MMNFFEKIYRRLKFYALSAFYRFERSLCRQSLKRAYKDRFLIGTAVTGDLLFSRNAKPYHILLKHFNTVTIADSLKPYSVCRQLDRYDFQLADKMVAWAERRGMTVIGHYLISSIMFPRFFFADENGNDVSREVLIDRMRNYIHAVVGRYKGRIRCWEAVHEVFDSDGRWLDSKFYRILGEDFVGYAFRFAREADPDCELLYSDSALCFPEKRAAVIAILQKLRSQGIMVDTVGMQGHVHFAYPPLADLEKAIEDFSNANFKISITEMDFSVLPVYNPRIINTATALDPAYWETLNPYKTGLPEKIAQMQAKRYADFFKIFLKHSDCIDRVTFWGITDDTSAKNDFPVIGRTDYPLLWDRKYRAKPVVKELIGMGQNNYY